MFKLFQIQLSEETRRKAQLGIMNDEFNAYLNAVDCAAFPGRDFYSHVADIEAYNLDHAFQIGNIGPREAITDLVRHRSVSVGDVLVNDAGTAFMVMPVGFEAVDGWNA